VAKEKDKGTSKRAGIKHALITHAQAQEVNNPYEPLARDWGLKFTFMNLVKVEGVPTPEFRKQNINPLDYSAIIFTSKLSIDHFFRICKDLRIEMPPDTKYFCVSEATAKYLQKYIIIRKRKLFTGEKTVEDLIDKVKKHSSDKYLFPSGEKAANGLLDYMQAQKMHLKEATVYQMAFEDLSSLELDKYDLFAFFSPNSIEALFKSFPAYAQGEKLVAVFGPATAKAAQDAGLRIDIQAPSPEYPSMTMAIDAFLRKG
jgi:uroporphyrinogen-III synthase